MDYYELHIPSTRNGKEYDFETNYDKLESMVAELKDIIIQKKPRMEKDIAKSFIAWISSLNAEEDFSLDEFRYSLGSHQIKQFNKSFMNRLDPTTISFEDHFFCNYCPKDDSVRKSPRQPNYIFEINSTIEPTWT